VSERTIIVYLYYRLFDPIVQSTLWLYIKDMLDDPIESTRIHVISYENPQFPLTPEQRRLAEAWQAQGLEWTALSWHRGIGLGQKLADLLAGFRVAFAAQRRPLHYGALLRVG
jgi:hypothetical protein